jgi:hypothetical protein
MEQKQKTKNKRFKYIIKVIKKRGEAMKFKEILKKNEKIFGIPLSEVANIERKKALKEGIQKNLKNLMNV